MTFQPDLPDEGSGIPPEVGRSTGGFDPNAEVVTFPSATKEFLESTTLAPLPGPDVAVSGFPFVPGVPGDKGDPGMKGDKGDIGPIGTGKWNIVQHVVY